MNLSRNAVVIVVIVVTCAAFQIIQQNFVLLSLTTPSSIASLVVLLRIAIQTSPIDALFPCIASFTVTARFIARIRPRFNTACGNAVPHVFVVNLVITVNALSVDAEELWLSTDLTVSSDLALRVFFRGVVANIGGISSQRQRQRQCQEDGGRNHRHKGGQAGKG